MWDRPFTKIFAGPSISRSLVFKMKKLLDDGLGLMWWPRGGKKRFKWNEQWIMPPIPVFAGEGVNADAY